MKKLIYLLLGFVLWAQSAQAQIITCGPTTPCTDSATAALSDITLTPGNGVLINGANASVPITTNATFSVSSSESNFLTDGGTTVFTCGLGTSGMCQTLDNGEIDCCDGAGTPKRTHGLLIPLNGTSYCLDPDRDEECECTLDINGALDCLAPATTGGSLTIKEGANQGTNTYTLKAPNAGCTSSTTATLTTGDCAFPACPAGVTWVLPFPFPGAFEGTGVTTASAPGTAEQLRCRSLTAGCGRTLVGLAFNRSTGGAANSQDQVGIYSADGTVQLIEGDIEDATGTGMQASTISAVVAPNTGYQLCYAASVTAGIVISGTGLNSSFEIFAAAPLSFTPTNTAQFNDTCTASVTPYACCTGANTGTCGGLPATLGTLNASSSQINSVPLVLVY